MSRRLSAPSLVVASAALATAACLTAGPAIAGKPTPKSARPVAGGYYVGKTAEGKKATADVSPDKKQVSAASFNLVCGGQKNPGPPQKNKKQKNKGRLPLRREGGEAGVVSPT